ncbi:MAG: PEP/pyruvate-binding domain-containing protein [Chloroflexi bacterium]|nr:PEP/pyruvate-binding domain-containing protein [Chloroflexota bacterium]MCI0575437.1 PEP/pyruvate-binding domain-containing protein [Chloroflexota bacterium]MCI0649881.1 PEP/pyruvate-binding domain-containing protein [Chloroflexota bacterium]MCI0725651.1 PEP/pyruvate-binding domain-containing protein [Chloroflexota bacterium]
MDEPLRSKTATIDIYIKLAQYPILAEKIRLRMREELFRRGIISKTDFEAEVKLKAMESQIREGLRDPFNEEPAATWQKRKAFIRDYHTDFYFGHNLSSQLFEQIVQEVLNDQPSPSPSVELSFNPELAPWELLFEQGKTYEKLPPPELEKVRHHLEEIKAVLIKGMLSDQLPYVGVARKVFDVRDLEWIHQRRIGGGKIGGKAAGMLLAWKILQQRDPEIGPDISQHIAIPESYFIATEVIYDFRLMNKLDYLMNQKYRSLDEIRDDYPKIVEAHLQGRFPEKIVDQLRDVLDTVGNMPLIVRSSSLLEDNFGHSFAGKYQSHFLPNQGTPEQNLQELLDAIRRIYASTLNPDAILYRQRHNLIDYDERMAILLQTLRGRPYGRYFLPSVAGVGFSQNTFRWNPKIRREEGFLRMVWGIGTRAVDRVSNDYPRLIALSHPNLRPETTAKAIRQYTQRYVDVIDLQENAFKTLPMREVLEELMARGYPDLRYITSVDKGDYIEDLISAGAMVNSHKLILTFDYLIRQPKFVKLMRTALMRLEQAYNRPVDIEFTVEIVPDYPYPDFVLHVLQCRPLSQREEGGPIIVPRNIPEEDILFTSYELIPDGKIEGIRYAIFVDPRQYRQIASQTTRLELGRAIGRLNKKLEGKTFIVIGPGRWGSANIDLGVRVSYADIYNTRALIEMAIASEDGVPELSYGTHFYQDLVEAGIHSLPLHLQNPKSCFDWSFFCNSPNVLAELSPQDAPVADYLRVIDVPAVAGGRRLTILMDGSGDEAIGFLTSGDWREGKEDKGTVSTF